jgi:hypothetical protein
MHLVLAALLSLSVLAPWIPPAWAQDSTALQTERRQRRFVVLPRPDAGQVSDDVDRAAERLAGRRADEMVRETVEPERRRRPDLRYDVTSTLQQRAVDAVRRR